MKREKAKRIENIATLIKEGRIFIDVTKQDEVKNMVIGIDLGNGEDKSSEHIIDFHNLKPVTESVMSEPPIHYPNIWARPS